jgi:hypothetical protein
VLDAVNAAGIEQNGCILGCALLCDHQNLLSPHRTAHFLLKLYYTLRRNVKFLFFKKAEKSIK